jgi:Uma2 family endonuclease
MTVLEREEIAGIEPRPRRWTREEFYCLAEMGLFHGQRAELIEGEIMVLSPQKWLHASTVDRLAEVLRNGLGAHSWVRTQLPLNLSPFSDPEPDVSIVAGRREDYTDHPTTALLIVEVSDTSLAFDRENKGSLYARMGIIDYWIVNLVHRQLEVYRRPITDAAQPYGHRYADVTLLSRPAVVTPLAAPTVSFAVADLVP